MKHNKTVLSKLAKKQIENIGGKTLIFNEPMIIEDNLIHISLFTLPNGAQFIVMPYFEEGRFNDYFFFEDGFLTAGIYKNEPFDIDSYYNEQKLVEAYSIEYKFCLDKKYLEGYKI